MRFRALCAGTPKIGGASDSLHGIPAEIIVKMMVEQIQQLQSRRKLRSCVGVGLPGIVRNGTVEDSPNYIQFKGHEHAGDGGGRDCAAVR